MGSEGVSISLEDMLNSTFYIGDNRFTNNTKSAEITLDLESSKGDINANIFEPRWDLITPALISMSLTRSTVQLTSTIF